jgi:hypothetical protein
VEENSGRGKTTIQFLQVEKKIRERKTAGKERQQFQFSHVDENGGRGRKQLEKWRERKDDNFNFHTWRKMA